MSGFVQPPEPAQNPILLGQERVEAILLRARRTGRLPHAWLFRGPRGVGKATLAFRFARRLLAGRDDEQAAADPAHPVFRMVANNAHPDLQVLQRVVNPKTGRLFKEVSVEQVRVADAALHATAARAGYKVLVADAIDEFNASSANALLKLLEEPPPRVVLLLVCQRPGMLPRTILSRCAHVTLAPLSREEVRRGLATLAPAIEPAAADTLAGLAEGCIGRALTLAASGWLDLYADLLRRLAEAQGSESLRLMLPFQLMPKGDGQSFRGTAELLATILRRLARLEAAGAPPGELFDGETQALQALAAGRGLDHWVALWDKLHASARRVEALNLDPLQALIPLVQGIYGLEPEAGR